MTGQFDYQALMLASNPLAYWSFQGLAPGALFDVTTNGHDLTGHGGYTLANPFGALDGFQAADLNGTSGYFTAAVPTALNPTVFSVVTLCLPQAGDAIMFDTEDQATLTSGMGLIVGDAGHQFAFGARLGTGGGNTLAQDTKSFGAYGSGPVQAAMTYDGLTLVCYINGQVIASNVVTSPSFGTRAPSIGAYSNNTRGYFKGLISDTAIFGAALPLATITQAAVTAGLQSILSAPQVIGLLDLIYAAVHRSFPTT